jgi:hypothetical protein
MNHERLFKYIGVAAIMLLLSGLSGWYFFLRGQASNIESTDGARGFSIGIPSFLGSRGSTSAHSEASVRDPAIAASGEVPPPTSSQSAFSRFLGLGRGKLVDEGNGEIEGGGLNGDASTATEQIAPRLFRVSAAPVAGADFLSSTTPTLRYAERATGYVVDVNPRTGITTRRTNTLVPKLYEAHIGQNDILQGRVIVGNSARTLGAKVGTSSSDGFAPLQFVQLGETLSVRTLSSSPDTLSLIATTNGSKLIRSSWNGARPTQILTIPAGSFHILWPAETRIALVDRAASGVPGNVYAVGSSLTPLLDPLPGLTVAMSPTGKLVFGTDDGRILRLFAQSASSTITELPVATIAEKCVWGRDSTVIYCAVPRVTGEQFLTRWYRGQIHTEDVWYTIQSSGEATKLFSMDTTLIDVELPVLDASGNYLAFMNARDKSLWILRIKE